MIKIIMLLLLIFTASWYAVAGVSAQEIEPPSPTDNDVNAIAKQLYCPVCPNTPLDVCETKACQDWRAQIKDQLSAGWTEEQIIGYFVEQYGERVLAEPQRSGFTSLVWIFPVIAVALGIYIVWQVLRGWRDGQKPEIVSSSPERQISREILDQIEQELQKID
jgi:cytochrome c-type biogenesis protein CcmH